MNNFKVFFIIISTLLFSQNDISIREYNIYKNKYESEVDMKDLINNFNGNYLLELISIDNINLERKKKIIIEICDVDFSIISNSYEIIIKQCNNELEISDKIYLDDNNSILTFDTSKYKYLECELTFWVYGNFNNESDVDVEDGILKEYYDNGNVKIEYNYKNGKKNGVQKKWYLNNQLSIKYNYENGKLDGLQKKWYENGNIKSESNYNNDILNGISRYWFSNGQIKYLKLYKDGLLVDILESYDENGNSR
ncbi:MAG: hypothetical protein CMG50_03850 [Candidatus Marinimicrobia bacterium]|nr:hypothetical protein [Candidatus Neomarinimicrobiota bacterium]|tara:strand:+ start:16255 stop:17010 length:756 start_codon:yes stop_codon:yes gene_type:complete